MVFLYVLLGASELVWIGMLIGVYGFLRLRTSDKDKEEWGLRWCHNWIQNYSKLVKSKISTTK
jgi:hypothetical protein